MKPELPDATTRPKRKRYQITGMVGYVFIL